MKVITSKAPARVCLFGEHQDYLGLPIIACSIDKYITIKGSPNRFKKFRIQLPDLNKKRIISINKSLNKVKCNDYFELALKVLKKYNCIPKEGYDVMVTSEIPINAGLSSSSALMIAWINFLREICGKSVENQAEWLGKVAYEAEVLETGKGGGKMDQYAIALGNVILLNTGKDLSWKKLSTSFEGLVIAESGIPKNTIAVLQKLKFQTRKAISLVLENFPDFNLLTAKLKDVTTYSSCLPINLVPYFYAAMKNYDITKKAIELFEQPKINLNALGKLMNEHHNILQDHLQITTPKIDQMINAAQEAEARGAKIVGSGGGGSIVIMTSNNKKNIINAILKQNAVKAYPVSVNTGAYIQT